jgi:large subunit ribosomal protein L6
MSRIGRLPIPVPAGVDITIDGTHVAVTGPKGQLARDISPVLSLVREDGILRVERPLTVRNSIGIS